MSDEEAPQGGVNRLTSNIKLFAAGLTMSGGDVGSLCQLFFDNLSTMLGALFALQALTDQGDISVSTSTMNDYLWGKIVPGVGLSLFIGNIFYSWQAIRMTVKHKRQYTAQPYGLNTPGAFAFVFNIIYTIFFSEGGGDQAFIKGYNVALAANVVTGLISILLGCFGRLILKVVPPAALLVPIASLGFAFLGLNQLTECLAAPIVGYNAIIWVYLGWYAQIRLGVGNIRIPEACQVILVGMILGWATGLNTGAAVSEAASLVKWYGPAWSAPDLFANFSDVVNYLGLVIPLGISAAATSLMCLVSAKEAGDPFPVRESLIADGIGTVLSSFLGSPFGTVIYIGHPAYKRVGAKVGYSLVNGIIYWILSWFGVLAVIQSFVNQATIGPIVFFVALMINEEALNFMPSRHYGAYIIGLMPSIFDYITTIAARSPLLAMDGNYDSNSPGGSAWVGVLSWKRGSLLVSMLWVAIVVNVIDRQWKTAIIWSLVAAFFALFGIVHVPEAGFSNLNSPFWEQCTDPDTCWEFANQWMFVCAYCMFAATFAIIWMISSFDDTIKEPIDDESRHAFDDWFKDAYTFVDGEGNNRDSRDNTIIKSHHTKTLEETHQDLEESEVAPLDVLDDESRGDGKKVAEPEDID